MSRHPANPDFKLIEHIDVPLVTTTTRELLSTHAALHRLSDRAKAIREKRGDVKFDLSGCNAWDPGGLLLLMYNGAQLRSRGWTTWAGGVGGVTGNVTLNINHMFADKANRGSIPKGPGDFLLRRIEDRNEMVSELQEWADSVKEGTSAKDEQVAMWQVQIAEVTTNGFQHGSTRLRGELPPILVVGKAYPKRGVVMLAALDYGSGIPRVIETASEAGSKPKRNMKDGDLIVHACKRGVTSRCVPQNQGAGLHSLVKAVMSNGGSVLILSNNGLSRVTASRQIARNLSPLGTGEQVLSGTLTIITLKIG